MSFEMECEKKAMSFPPTKELICSPISSLGGGDTSFQTILGVQTHQLSFSSSPGHIFRQRNPYSVVSHYEAEKVFLGKEANRSIHMSLENLSENQNPSKDEHHRRSTSNIVIESNCNGMGHHTMLTSIERKNIQAARRIYAVLMLNAWRKRKEDSEDLKKWTQKLTSELDRYKMKLHLLKSILNKETERNAYAMKEIATLKSRIHDHEKIIDAMKEEIEQKERMALELDDTVSSERILRSNIKNELIESKMEVTALVEQLAKERDKLKKLRGEMEYALDKVQELEECIVSKDSWIQRLDDTLQKEKELHACSRQQLEDEKSRYRELLDENKRLTRVIDDLEEVKKAFEEEISRSSEEARVREDRVSTLEMELQSHQYQLTNSKTLISEILQERRQLESLNERKESDFVILAKSIFSGVGRLPLTIFHSVTHALWPFEAFGGVQRSNSFH